MKAIFDTKVTNIDGRYHCLVYKIETKEPIVEAIVDDKCDIGPAFRCLLRTLNKCGWQCPLCISAHRRGYHHNNKKNNRILSVYNIWHGPEGKIGALTLK